VNVEFERDEDRDSLYQSSIEKEEIELNKIEAVEFQQNVINRISTQDIEAGLAPVTHVSNKLSAISKQAIDSK
jgi:hypothetical protein